MHALSTNECFTQTSLDNRSPELDTGSVRVSVHSQMNLKKIWFSWTNLLEMDNYSLNIIRKIILSVMLFH